MENTLKKDYTYLKGDYYIGFNKISSTLDSGLIPKSFKEEVEADVLELFIRNQDNNKEFDEVIGGDIDEFIRNIVDVYLDETSIKTKVLKSVAFGMVVSAIFFGIDIILYSKATIANIVMCGASMIIISLTMFLSYKISKKINPKNAGYISFGVGFLLSILSNHLNKNVSVFNSSLKTEVNVIATVGILVVIIIIGSIILKKIDNYN